MIIHAVPIDHSHVEDAPTNESKLKNNPKISAYIKGAVNILQISLLYIV